ncbi:MAG: alpha/beta hydrolase-fold protein [Lacipirellulaceae bacterium]
MRAFHKAVLVFVAIVAGLPAPLALAIDYNNSLSLTFPYGTGQSLPYRLFLPPGHDAPGASFPLVLFLHGAGERGTNNSSQLAYIDGLVTTARTDHPAYLLVPQAPRDDYWGSAGPGEWSPATQATIDLMASIESQYTIDPLRRYVTGLSMGGFGTWDLVAGLPGRFAAAAPMSSWGDVSEPQRYVGTRLWAFQGNNDTVTPAGPARSTVRAIREAGGDILYSEVLGDHGIWRPIYDDPNGELYDWMFDAVEPPLAEWTYDPSNGSVRIDTRKAPGGRAFLIRFTARQTGVLTIPLELSVNGVPTATSAFFTVVGDQNLTHNSDSTGGFAGVVEIPGLMPRGLTLEAVYGLALQQFYASAPSGARRLRAFDVRIGAVPEPAGAWLMACAAIPFLGRRRGPSFTHPYWGHSLDASSTDEHTRAPVCPRFVEA